MIAIKNEHELEAMREACKITAAARALAGEMVRPGVSTKAIDQAVHDYIVSQGAKPSFLNYSGYPASACISVNSTVIHGIPGHYILKDGDIVSVDVGAYFKGFHGDCAAKSKYDIMGNESAALWPNLGFYPVFAGRFLHTFIVVFCRRMLLCRLEFLKKQQ